MNNLKKIAKENEEKGYQKAWEIYTKFNQKVDKVLSEILGEKEEEKFGIFDLWRWIKDKYKKINKKMDKENMLNEKDKKDEKDNSNSSINQ